MAYTVKTLSQLAGVTVRALHFYEKKGLLKPAYYGANGYRYYEQEELLQLQQILFFKALGLSIMQIQEVMGRSSFDCLSALISHRRALCEQKERTEQLIQTVDRTIQHLKGNTTMNDKEFFDGLVLIKPDPDSKAEKIVLDNLRSQKGQPNHHEVKKQAHQLLKRLTNYLKHGLEPGSGEVQAVIAEHHAFSDRFHIATKEVYQALAELYREHESYRLQLTPFDSELPNFMSRGMEIYAELNL